MKLILLIPSILLLAQTPTPFDTSKIDFSKISEEDIRKTEAHRDQLLKDAQQAANAEHTIIIDHSSTLGDIKTATDKTAKAFDDYKKATEEQIAQGNKAIIAAAHLTKLLHRAKCILSAVWLAFCVMLFFKIPPPLGAYIVAILAAAGSAFIWLWI